jgi:hypothetical protein
MLDFEVALFVGLVLWRRGLHLLSDSFYIDNLPHRTKHHNLPSCSPLLYPLLFLSNKIAIRAS